MLLIGFVAEPSAPLKTEPGIWQCKRSRRTNLPQELLYKFVPSTLKFSLQNATVHFSRSNDVRMGPFRWLPVLGSCPKIALFQRYLANSDLIFVAHTFGRSMQVDSVLWSSLDTWNLKPPSTQSWFTYIPIIVAGGSSLKSFILC